MKKVIKLLPIFVLSSALISSPSTKVNFYEEARDPFLTSEIKKANIETSSENEVFPTISQHGYDENGNQYLRFLTPFSLKSSSVKLEYTRTYETSIVKKEVSTVYESVNLQGKLNYWNGTEFSNVKGEKTYYIASYTIKFDTSVLNYSKAALDYQISASLSLVDGSTIITSTAKTTSVNENRKDVTVKVNNSGLGELRTKSATYKVGDLIEFDTIKSDESFLSSLKLNGADVADLSKLSFIASSENMEFDATFTNGYFSRNLLNDGEIHVNADNQNKTYDISKEADGYHIKFTHTDGVGEWDNVYVNFDKDNFDYNYLTLTYEVLSNTHLNEIGVEIGAKNEKNKFQTFSYVDSKETGIVRRTFALNNIVDSWGVLALRFDRTAGLTDVEVLVRSIELVKSTYTSNDANASIIKNNINNASDNYDVKPSQYGFQLVYYKSKDDWGNSYVVCFDKSKNYSKITISLTFENESKDVWTDFFVKTNDYEGAGGKTDKDGLNEKWGGIQGGWNYFELIIDPTKPVSNGSGELIIHTGVGGGTGYRSVIIHEINFVLSE